MKTHAAIVLINDSNDVLFVQRSYKKSTLPGAWSFPSGTVEEGESVESTAAREAMEELGVGVEVVEIFAKKDLEEFGVRLEFVLCKVVSGVPKIVEVDEIEKISWLKFSDFFDKHSDNNIGHGLVWLRKNPKVWEKINFVN